MQKPGVRIVSGGVALLFFVGYVFLQHTSSGRIAGVYLVGGWQAPWSVRTDCRHTAVARVEELFTKPLAMDGIAQDGLREYWHYSYYRECLYRAGYSFGGEVLPTSTLYRMTDTEHWYINRLAGVYLLVPAETRIVRDNELDVTYDARLLRSELMLPDGSLFLDTYTSHQFVKTFADLSGYLTHFTASSGTPEHTVFATTTGGIPYLEVAQDNGWCGAMIVTPNAYILHLFAACADEARVHRTIDTLKLIPAVSTH